MGGEHIWDGLVGGIIDSATSLRDLFPVHESISLDTKITSAFDQIFSLIVFLNSLQLFWLYPTFVILTLILSLETLRWILSAWRWITNLVGFG
jgi:hypothetical protein